MSEPSAGDPHDEAADPANEAVVEGSPSAATGEGQFDLAWQVPMWSIGPLFLLAALVFVLSFGWSRLLVSLIPLAALLAAVTVIDLRELRIPNRLLGPAAIAAVPLLIVASTAQYPDLSLLRALAGAGVFFGLYLALALIYPPGLGLGDVKFAPILGAQLGLLGWELVFRAMLGAWLLNGPIGVILLLTRRAKRDTGLPHGPFMAASTVIALALEAAGI